MKVASDIDKELAGKEYEDDLTEEDFDSGVK